jgi:hypothetical protein
MCPVQSGALGALFFCAPKGCAESHSNRDPDAQPNRNVPGQNSGSRAQRRS